MAETRTEPRATPEEAAPGAMAAEDAATGDAAERPSSKEHVCNVAFCPIGMALSAVHGAAPDVMEHLLKAASEFLLAARAVIDARAADFEDAPEGRTLQKIEIS